MNTILFLCFWNTFYLHCCRKQTDYIVVPTILYIGPCTSIHTHTQSHKQNAMPCLHTSYCRSTNAQKGENNNGKHQRKKGTSEGRKTHIHKGKIVDDRSAKIRSLEAHIRYSGIVPASNCFYLNIVIWAHMSECLNMGTSHNISSLFSGLRFDKNQN